MVRNRQRTCQERGDHLLRVVLAAGTAGGRQVILGMPLDRDHGKILGHSEARRGRAGRARHKRPKRPNSHASQSHSDFGRFGRTPPGLTNAFAALERRRPDQIELNFWQQAVEDGRRFLTRWGGPATALTASDLFGLHRVPDNPTPNYRRLSRYDETGLVWLLCGRPVVALTDATAVIEGRTGVVTMYRKNHKPSLGPLGDSS